MKCKSRRSRKGASTTIGISDASLAQRAYLYELFNVVGQATVSSVRSEPIAKAAMVRVATGAVMVRVATGAAMIRAGFKPARTVPSTWFPWAARTTWFRNWLVGFAACDSRCFDCFGRYIVG